MNRRLVLCLFPVLILACGMAAPTQTAPIPTATARPAELVQYSEPEASTLAEVCTLQAVTDTNVRECASLTCAITGDLILKGDIISAACNAKWALVIVDGAPGWVCVPALMQTGGCE